jgi:predicted metal-binding protein
MEQSEQDAIEKFCLEQNALEVRFIDPKSIVVGHWPRYKCQYGCPSYGRSLCCPPFAPSPDTTRRIIADYSLGILARFGRGVHVTQAMVEIERQIFLRNYYKAISFGAGSCRLCKECALSVCNMPKLARPSMEACGIDVYATVTNNGFPIHVLASKDGNMNCYGLVLVE